MTTRADYTPEEWQLLVQAPILTALNVVVAGADGSADGPPPRAVKGWNLIATSPTGPVSVMLEMLAVWKAILDTAQQPRSNDLISAVATEFKEAPGRAARLEGLKDLTPRSLDVSRRVAVLLDQKASPEEATAYKQWLVDLARCAAEAANEGGVMGFGGVAVSAAEMDALDDMIKALGLKS
jgi:hypothetical protein